MDLSTQEAEVSNPVKLAFGAEFECVWISEEKDEEDDIQGLSYLRQIQEIFSKNDLPLKVQHNPNGIIDYSFWNITYDGSINAKDLTLEQLPARCVTGSWTASSAELISPPLPAPDTKNSPALTSSHPSLAVIEQYIQTIKGTPETAHSSFANSNCGFHVHFGIEPGQTGGPSDSTIPLPVLQELAFLLVRFENIISGLHSSGRRGRPLTTSGRYCRSNLISFLEEGHTCGGQPLIPLEEVRDRIFAPGMTVEKLAWIMGAEEPLDPKLQPKKLSKSCKSTQSTSRDFDDESMDWRIASFVPSKYKMVNWSPLCAKDGPRTIEFRQPDGTLDEKDIAYVIWFYTALIRAAERLASHSPGAATNEPASKEADTPTLANLLDLFDIHDPGVREYWMDRQQQYADSEFEPDLKKWQKCHLCAHQQEHRQLLRRRRKVVSHGGWTKGKSTKGMTRKEKRNAKTDQRVRNRRAAKKWILREEEGPCADANEPRREGFW